MSTYCNGQAKWDLSILENIETAHTKPRKKQIKANVLTKDINETPLEPLLKWAGGKEKELKYILPNLPEQINDYYEPFVGGGSVFTAIKSANRYFINDFSCELIDLYRNIAEQNIVFFQLCGSH